MTGLNPYDAPEGASTVSVQRISYRKLWPTLVVAVLLFLVTAPVGSAFTAIGLGLVIVPVQSLLLVVSIVRRSHTHNGVTVRLLRFAIYIAMVVAMLAHASFEHRTARAQAVTIVEACHAYERDHGALPAELGILVPNYLPAVPTSLGYFSNKTYLYSGPTADAPAYFMYMHEPLGRTWYDFATREWTSYMS